MTQVITPTQWTQWLAPAVPWQEAYSYVGAAARGLLDRPIADAPRTSYTTTELVEELFPRVLARGDGITARQRIFKALKALEKHELAPYCSKGEPRNLPRLKTLITPTIWHARDEVDENFQLRLKIGAAIDQFEGKLHSEKIDAILEAIR